MSKDLQLQSNTTVSIGRARRILGKYSKQLSDDQIRDIIHTLQLLAREQLIYNGSKEVPTHESTNK